MLLGLWRHVLKKNKALAGVSQGFVDKGGYHQLLFRNGDAVIQESARLL